MVEQMKLIKVKKSQFNKLALSAENLYYQCMDKFGFYFPRKYNNIRDWCTVNYMMDAINEKIDVLKLKEVKAVPPIVRKVTARQI